MKNIFKTLLIAFILIGFQSCSDSELAIDKLYDQVDTSGAVIRLLEPPNGIVNLESDTPFPNFIAYNMEIQEGDGSFDPTFTEVRVFVTAFSDNDLSIPITDAEGNDIPELSVETVNVSQFDVISDVNGLPSHSISNPTQDFYDMYPEGSLPNNTYLLLRWELEMSDGRIFSAENAGGSLGADLFAAPFAYKIKFRTNN